MHAYVSGSTLSKETYYTVKRDLLYAYVSGSTLSGRKWNEWNEWNE
jgi:hypothetical protein